MVKVRLLDKTPGNGSRTIAFPTQWELAGRDGILVEFETELGRWVGNFKPTVLPGRRGINLVGVHPNKRDAVVVATGDLWVINPETRTGEQVLSCIDAALEVREPEGWVFSRYGLALMRFGPEGVIWHTRRLSLGGFKSLSCARNEVKGVAEERFEGRPASFVVDGHTGSPRDGRYGNEAPREWERQSVRMLSPNLASIVSMEIGKYLRWAARRLDADTLESLLSIIGEFATRFDALRTLEGRLPEPVFYPHWKAEQRMRNALNVFASVPRVGKVQWAGSPFSGGADLFTLSEHISGFSPAYRERLREARTAWAQRLDERSLGLLLWMVGEYGVRVNFSVGPNGAAYPPPSFNGDPNITRPMRAALRLIAMIHQGDRISSSELSRFIAEEES